MSAGFEVRRWVGNIRLGTVIVCEARKALGQGAPCRCKERRERFSVRTGTVMPKAKRLTCGELVC